MQIICAWCNLDLGRKAPFDNNSVSHGICESCSIPMLDEIFSNTKPESKIFEDYLDRYEIR